MKRLLLLLLMSCSAFTAQVGKFNLNDTPEKINGGELEIPDGVVAMSEYVKISNSSETFEQGGPSSIFFVIDNSISMFAYLKDNNPNTGLYDVEGARYQATMDIIDSIYHKSPDTEIGLSVFSAFLYFDPADDELFDEIITYKDKYEIDGGYIPLLKLNAPVTKGKFIGKDGYFVLKHYLQTSQFEYEYQGTNNTFQNLTYEPTNKLFHPYKIRDLGISTGTNIWAGFSAAKEAMLKSVHPKEKQFIIFLSDGSHYLNTKNAPDMGPTGFTKWEELVVPECPTTFTVFFNPNDSSTTKKLTGFTKTKPDGFWVKESVAFNNYSSSNPKSDLWAITAGREKLVDTLMTNVVADIIKTTTKVTPSKISIQNIDANGTWDGTGFTFTNLFPLSGTTTPISYSIEYTISRDSVLEDGTIKVVESKQEKLDIDYDAVLKQNPTPSLEYELLWWERSLLGYEQDTVVTIVESPKGNFQIRFEEEKIDTLYDYPEVEITVSTKVSGDVEVVTLDKNEKVQSFTMPRQIGSAASKDGTIQHEALDTILLSYENPELPLDTISIAIPVDASRGYAIARAVFHDSKGDGQLDQIFLTISGDSLVDEIAEIATKLELPTERQLNITTVTKTAEGLRLTVTEDGDIRTAMQSFDKVVLADTLTLSDGSIVNPVTLTAVDSMAPVLLEASLVDSIKSGAEDILTIRFSEPVSDVFASAPFHFFNSDITPELQKLSLSGDLSSWNVLNDLSLANEDSVNIALNDPQVKDVQGIVQTVDNSKVKLHVTIVADGLQISEAINRDDNGDGFVDRIELRLNQTIEGGELSKLVENLELSGDRNFSDIAASLKDGHIELTLRENSSTPNTALFSDEKVTLKNDIVLTDTTTLRANSVNVTDGVAPVLLTALVEDSVKSGAQDFLTVTFSEDIAEQFSETPFVFFDGDNTPSLELTSFGTTKATFLITESGFTPTAFDSVNIAVADIKITDNNNEQSNSSNRKVELQINRIAESVAIDHAFYRDTDGDGLMNELVLTLNRELNMGDVSGIIDNLELPTERSLTAESAAFNGTSITVELNDNGEINTALFSGEQIELTGNIVLSDTAMIPAGTVALADSVAPVIIDAEYRFIENRNHQFTVTFSESMGESGSEKPFTFVDRDGNNPYELSLNNSSIDNRTISYDVTDGVCHFEDSVSISPSEGVADAHQNEQTRDNRRVEIRYFHVTERTITEAVYFDRDNRADGYIDEVRVQFDGDIPELLVDVIANAIVLAEDRLFNLNTSELSDNNTISLSVEQDREQIQPKTDTDESDTVSITEEFSFAEDTLLFTIAPVAVEAVDSLAPVILEARYLPMTAEDDGELIDTLKLIFSEKISSVESGERFALFDESDDRDVELTTNSGNSGREIRFTMTASEPLPSPDGMDSISIIGNRSVKDRRGVEQKVNTLRVPLSVAPYRYKFDVTIFPNPFKLNEHDYENPVIEKYGDNSTPRNAIAVMIKPKGNRRLQGEISAKVAAFDNAGNQVFESSDGDFRFQEISGVLLNAIQPSNDRGRSLASGAYMGVVTIQIEGETRETVQEKVMIGVQK